MVWKREDPYIAESKKIVWEVAPYLRGRGVDIGAGDFRVMPHAMTVDNWNHAQFGFTQKPDILAEGTDISILSSQTMDFVYSSHTLEHIEDTAKALKEWWRLVKVGGYLVLYLPHGDFYPKVGEDGANPDHKVNLWPKTIIDAMPAGWDLVENQERNGGNEYSFLQVFKKVNGTRRTESWKTPKPEKTACVVRYGAYGDMMQATSVWAALKKEGYHVTVFASLPGASVIEHDPNIDRLVLFDKDQVPNGNLLDFWTWQKKKFDRWVNLSETVEGTLLAMPGRTLHWFNKDVRHSLMNRNYVEFQHHVAGLAYSKPEDMQIKFYATAVEKEEAIKFKKKQGGGKLIMWSLAGSAVHKTWAGLDNVMAAILLEYPDCHIILVGGAECKVLEAGWENEPRVIKRSGVWTMRQTLSVLPHCDLIIGPETGVLNAAACMPVPKVCILSHSTTENLTRDWTNCTPVFTKVTPCYPCHMLHYGFEHCHQDKESGTAQCQVDIPISDVVGAAMEYLK